MRLRLRKGELFRRRDGSTAVEFAIVFPLFVIVMFGGVSFGMAMLNLNALQLVATQGARCIAISGSDCTTASSSCTDTAAECYIEALATNEGLTNVSASEITINTAYLVDSVSFVRVQIAYPMSLAGYSFSLTATAQFPNG